MLSPALKKYHDSVYVLTIPSATDRQAEVVRQLGEGNFEYVYGPDKNLLAREEMIESGAVTQEAAFGNGPKEPPMTMGHICCAIGHRSVYERFLETDGELALVFEDDLVDLEVPEREIKAALACVPRRAEIIYWGWDFGRFRPWNRMLQQGIDHVRSSLGLLDRTHAQISNRYMHPYNKYFYRSAGNYLLHAYTITREAARKMIDYNTPIAVNSDHAPERLIATGDMRGFLARKQLYGQTSFYAEDPSVSMTAE